MGVSVSEQAFVFFIMVVCGASIGVLFDMFRIFRKFVKLGTLGVNLSDFVFSVIAIVAFFFSLVYFNNGQLRWYEFVGVFLGGLLYFLLVSKWIMIVFEKIVSMLCKIILFIFKIVLTPLAFLYKILISPFISFIRIIWNQIKRTYERICGGIVIIMKERTKKEHAKKKAKARSKNKAGSVVKVLFVAALGFMFVKGAMQQPQITSNKQKIQELQSQVEYEDKRIEEVDALKEKVNTDEYIEKVAREKLGLVKENEKIFVDAASQQK